MSKKEAPKVDVFEFAMELERDGEAYYRAALERVEHTGIRAILTMLADAEVTHYRIFEEMRQSNRTVVENSRLLIGVRNVFREMVAAENYDLGPGEIDLCRKAQDIEQNKIDFYVEKGNKTLDPYSRSLFLKVAEEERKHYAILEGLISLAASPEQWIKDNDWGAL
jgi:rubrerythrin